jgi:hypothetical protein
MIEAVRVFAVIAMVTTAAVLATPPGRVPLALKGLFKMLGKNSESVSGSVAPVWKRAVAFILVLAAAVVAMI